MELRDVIEKVGNSLIQHGKLNDRVYLMKLSKEDFPAILGKLEDLVLTHKYTKVFAKVPDWTEAEFIANGYKKEAFIPRFYNGSEDVYFLGKYFSQERMEPVNSQKLKEVLTVAKEKGLTSEKSERGETDKKLELKKEFQFKVAEPSDVFKMAEVYAKVFKTYPFPIDDPKYILKTMQENVIYFSIWQENELVALASSEMDIKADNVEMTDFATSPEYTGRGFAKYLLQEMEGEMKKRGIKTAYTIARALSFGMNITFATLGYQYSGTLINNTNIAGDLESMNIWYKFLD